MGKDAITELHGSGVRESEPLTRSGPAGPDAMETEAMKIEVTIQGTTPLLMNRFTEADEVAVSGGTAATLRGDKGTPRDQAEAKRYADEGGRLYIPGPNIFACIIAAGTFHKAGKSKLTTMKSSLIPAGLMVISDAAFARSSESS